MYGALVACHAAGSPRPHLGLVRSDAAATRLPGAIDLLFAVGGHYELLPKIGLSIGAP